MAKNQRYRPLNGTDNDGEERETNRGSSSAQSRSLPKAVTICAAALLLSLVTNVALILHVARLHRQVSDGGRTKYSGMAFDTEVPYRAYSEYWDPNISDEVTDRAWDAINTNPMAVSLHNEFARNIGLQPSTRFPWDTERSIYYLKGFHDLHCLKLIRKAIVSKHNQMSQVFDLHHLFHCLDGLRQDIMCTADDTPMPAPVAHHVGDGQIRKCRNWNKLKEWATRPDQNACHEFDDYREATNTLELFAYCPDDSPYRPVMEAYFEYHGHKDPYELKEHDTREPF